MQKIPTVLATLSDFHENKDEVCVSLDGTKRLADRCCPLARSYMALKSTAILALEQEGILRATGEGKRFPVSPAPLPLPPKKLGVFAKFLGFKPVPTPPPATNLFPEAAQSAAVAKATGIPTTAKMSGLVVTDEGIEASFDSGHVLKTDHRHDLALRTVRLLQEFDALHVENMPAMLAINQAMGRPMMRYEKVVVKQMERLHDDIREEAIDQDAKLPGAKPAQQERPDTEPEETLPVQAFHAPSSEADPTGGLTALDSIGNEFGPEPTEPAPAPAAPGRPPAPTIVPPDDVLGEDFSEVATIHPNDNPFNEGAGASDDAAASASNDASSPPASGPAVVHEQVPGHEVAHDHQEEVEAPVDDGRSWTRAPVRITQKKRPSPDGPFVLTAKSEEMVEGKPQALGDFEVEKEDYSVIQWLHQNGRDARFKIELMPSVAEEGKEQSPPKAKIVGVKMPNHSNIMVTVDWAHCRDEFEAANKKVVTPETRNAAKSAVIESETATPLLPGTATTAEPKKEEVEQGLLPLPILRPITVPKSAQQSRGHAM